MKTVCVWFSYPPDYGRLQQSVAAVRALDPEAHLAVVIEPSHPTPNIRGVEVWQIPFDRGTHLNGHAAVRGVLNSLAAIGNGYDLVVKIDCDKILSKAFWLDGPCMFQGCDTSFCGLYALPVEMVKMVAASLEILPGWGMDESHVLCGRARLMAWAMGNPLKEVVLPGRARFPDFVHEIPRLAPGTPNP